MTRSTETSQPSAPGADDGASSDQFLRVSDELTLRYRTAGTGDTALVFVPGWTMSCEVFEHQLEHFAGSTDYTAVSYDPRSQGLSSQTPKGHYYEQHARDLRALIESLDKTRVVLIGWSAGGSEVFEYLRVFGHRDVAGVVIIDIPPKVRGGDKAVDWVDFGTAEDGDQEGALRMFTFDLHVDREGFNREFASWMLDDPKPQDVEKFSQMSAQTPDLIAVQLIMSLCFVDGTTIAEELDGTIPVMYFLREDWQDVARNWLAKHAPKAEVHVHGTHLSFWQHPHVFNSALDGFLGRLG